MTEQLFLSREPGTRHRIHRELALAVGPLDPLRPYPKNARNGDVEAIAESLAVNGQYRPIVVNRGSKTGRPNEILVGNHTYAAALSLDWTHLAVTYVDVDEDAARRIVLADNRSSDLAWYDEGLLADLINETEDLTGTLVDEEYLSGLMAGLERQAVSPIGFRDEEPVPEPERAPEPPGPLDPPGPKRVPSATRDVVLVYPLQAENGQTLQAFGALISRVKEELGLSPAATVSEVVFSALAVTAGPEKLPPLPPRTP